MKKRVCVFCQKEFPVKVKLVKSWKKGEWICLLCFEKNIHGNQEEKHCQGMG